MKDSNECLPLSEIGESEVAEIRGWSLEDAMREQSEWQKKYPGKPRGPLFRWLSMQRLKELHKKLQDGEKGVVIDALFFCSIDGLPIPKWCADAFIQKYYEIVNFRAKSWDDLFGRLYPKGTHRGAKRRKREKQHAVWLRVRRIKDRAPETPIDEALFEKIGEEFGLGKTLAAEYYYSVENSMPPTSKGK